MFCSIRCCSYFYAADVHLLHKNIQVNFLPRFLGKSVVKSFFLDTLLPKKRGKIFTTLLDKSVVKSFCHAFSKSVVKVLPRF
jgi:hypothetical protein